MITKGEPVAKCIISIVTGIVNVHDDIQKLHTRVDISIRSVLESCAQVFVDSRNTRLSIVLTGSSQTSFASG